MQCHHSDSAVVEWDDGAVAAAPSLPRPNGPV